MQRNQNNSSLHKPIIHSERDYLRDIELGLNIDKSKKNLKACVHDFKKRVDQIDLSKCYAEDDGPDERNERAMMTKSQLESYLFTSKTRLPPDAKVIKL
jgi:hypothetical protein